MAIARVDVDISLIAGVLFLSLTAIAAALDVEGTPNDPEKHNLAAISNSTAPTYVGIMHTNEGRNTLNALTVGHNWEWTQRVVCNFPNATQPMFGSHQSSYAPRRRLLYKALQYGSDQKIIKVKVNQEDWTFNCHVLHGVLPIEAGQYRVDIFPDQEANDPKPTIVGALNGSPSTTYILYELLEEDSAKPEFKEIMNVNIPHQVQQIFGTYYDSEAMIEYIGFNEGTSFFNVAPCWLMVIDVQNRKVLNKTFYQHLSGYDIWYDAALKTFYIPTSDDCDETNKTGCFQGVRVWDPAASTLSDIQSNFCQGTACFEMQVGYGYAYNPSNHTGVVFGGDWDWYDVTTHAFDVYRYSTVFVISPVYVGNNTAV